MVKFQASSSHAILYDVDPIVRIVPTRVVVIKLLTEIGSSTRLGPIIILPSSDDR